MLNRHYRKLFVPENGADYYSIVLIYSVADDN